MESTPPAAPSSSAAALVAAPRAEPASPCRGPHLDLSLADADCRQLRKEPSPTSPALVLSSRSAGHVARGDSLVIDVILTNGGTTPLELFLDTGVEEDPHPSERVPASPRRTMTQFFPTARDAKGNRFERPKGSLPHSVIELSNIELRPPIRIELPPGGEAVAPIRWQATGFLPGKAYRSKKKKTATGTEFDIPGPDPLPPGVYSLELSVPLFNVEEGVTLTLAVTVD